MAKEMDKKVTIQSGGGEQGKEPPTERPKMGASKKRIRLSNMSQIKDQTYSYNHSPSLSRKSMKTLQAAIKSQKNKLTVISFIETHFKRKEFIIILYTLLSNLVHRDPHCARRNFSWKKITLVCCETPKEPIWCEDSGAKLYNRYQWFGLCLDFYTETHHSFHRSKLRPISWLFRQHITFFCTTKKYFRFLCIKHYCN